VRLTRVSYTVRATEKQALRWNRAAEGEGHRSVGTWLAEAADRHLDDVRRAGRPIPLGWRRGRYDVTLATGKLTNVLGMVSQPFAYFRGADDRQNYLSNYYTLVYLSTDKIIATLRTAKQVRALASELAAALLRGELLDAGTVVGRHLRECV